MKPFWRFRHKSARYDALGRAQQIIDAAEDSGVFSGVSSEVAVARAETWLGDEFADVEVVFDRRGRLRATERWGGFREEQYV